MGLESIGRNKILVTILIAAFILRVAFAITIPIFDKPDEQPHFNYVKFVAENYRIPIQMEGVHGESFQPPLYYFIASIVLNFAQVFTDDINIIAIVLRILSALISMFTLYFVFKIADLLFKNDYISLGSVAFASFLPTHINMNSGITNANLADFLSTLLIYLILKTLMKKEDNVLLFGVIAGLALITRLSVIPIFLVMFFMLLIKYNQNIINVIKPICIILIIALGISSFFFIRNYMLYGDILGITAMKMSATPDSLPVSTSWIARLIGWTFITFWAAFGRTNGVFVGNLTSATGITAFIVFYSILSIITIIAIFGLYKFFKNNYLKGWQKKSLIVMGLHLAILSISFVSFSIYNFQPQGRLFFPAISTISILFTLGILNILSPKLLVNNFKRIARAK